VSEVSVVVPTRESAAVLAHAIDSAFAQTHPPDELIVVDGGSSDGTRELLAAIDDPRLRTVLREQPEGVSAARNRGIAAAEGELVAFLDADDVWREDKLERQLAALARHDAAVAYGPVTEPEGEPRTRSGASGDVREAVASMAVPTYTSTLLVRREALRAVGGFDEQLPCFEDWELCLRLARERRFAFVDEPVVEKGTSGDNISADPDRLARAARRLTTRYELPAQTRGRLWADVGRTHVEAGRVAEAHPFLERSLAADRRQPKTWLALAATRAGSRRAYEAAMRASYALERGWARLQP
jgi:glycosyltransferase involved in cell wall biosynthesis